MSQWTIWRKCIVKILWGMNLLIQSLIVSIKSDGKFHLLFNFFFCFFYREFSGSNVIKRIFFWKHQAKWKDLDENISNLSNVVTMQPWIMEPSTKQLYTEEPGSIWYEQNENVKFQFEMLLVWTSTDLTLSLFLYVPWFSCSYPIFIYITE